MLQLHYTTLISSTPMHCSTPARQTTRVSEDDAPTGNCPTPVPSMRTRRSTPTRWMTRESKLMFRLRYPDSMYYDCTSFDTDKVDNTGEQAGGGLRYPNSIYYDCMSCDTDEADGVGGQADVAATLH